MVEKSKIIILAEQALQMRDKAYVPYSGFSVGAALLTKSGNLFKGCNIENVSYPGTICAERTAVFSAVANGELQFKAIAVAGGIQGREPDDYCVPCAICLQVLSEFCEPDFDIFVVKSEQEILHYTLRDLLPVVFDSLRKDG